jgi:uncharacterized membrane protein
VNLEPLLRASLPVQIHVATVIQAFILGTYEVFFRTKGSPHHRLTGYIYLTLMVITSIAALFIHQLNPSGFLGLSWIHAFVALTLFGVYGALVTARRHDIKGHRRAMLGVYHRRHIDRR